MLRQWPHPPFGHGQDVWCGCCTPHLAALPDSPGVVADLRVPARTSRAASREGVESPLSLETNGELRERLLKRGKDGRLLLKNGCVLTLDPAVGDFERADLLIEGALIRDVRPEIRADDALVIDMAGHIVMPGFVDTHRHCWQTVFRRAAPDADLQRYGETVNRISNVIRPDDVYLGNLMSCLAAIDSGVTTLLDWSHISNTPDHSDAAVQALMASGMRAIYAYGHSRAGLQLSLYPQDASRIRRTYFNADDQLVTMCLAANIDRIENWPLARALGLRITGHVYQPGEPAMVAAAGRAGLLGPDVTLVHCTPELGDETWEMVRDAGCAISLATPSIMRLGVGAGFPPIQRMLDHGIRPSLSVDMETCLPGDFFYQMRSTLDVQHALSHERRLTGGDAPALLTMRDVIGFATVEGARANGQIDRIGTLTPGKRADIIAIDAEDINTFPLNNAFGTVVTGADSRNVKLVLVDGVARKIGAKVEGHDLREIKRRVQAARDWLCDRSGLPLSVVNVAS